MKLDTSASRFLEHAGILSITPYCQDYWPSSGSRTRLPTPYNLNLAWRQIRLALSLASLTPGALFVRTCALFCRCTSLALSLLQVIWLS